MRIVVEPGSYTCLNMGDVAMLQVCVSRLAELWPGARIQVVTQSPERLHLFCPDVEPVPESGKESWFRDKIFGRLHNHEFLALRRGVQTTESSLRRHVPLAVGSLLTLKRRIKHLDSDGISGFVKAVLGANLVIASGTGMINDEFRDRALQMLATLGLANQHNVPTAMLCQGIGPASDAALLDSLKTVLPKVRLVSLRERLLGPKILQAVGYPTARVLVAGDDAVRLAFENRADVLGDRIGVNLRVAGYSQIAENVVNVIRPALQSAASELGTLFVPVPILFRDDSDMRAVAALISGCEDLSLGRPVMTPRDVITRIAHCRVVVTGSYHGAVFALAQGIPAVALARSPYYMAKFRGLQDQFGDGCQLIDWSQRVCAEQLTRVICDAWRFAQEMRHPLLKTAREQIRASDQAYRTLRSSLD